MAKKLEYEVFLPPSVYREYKRSGLSLWDWIELNSADPKELGIVGTISGTNVFTGDRKEDDVMRGFASVVNEDPRQITFCTPE